VEGISLLAPKIIILENVAAIRRRGLDRVLGDLAALGYDASWTSVRASDIGAAHRRERVFVLAHQPEARGLLTAAHAPCQRWSRRAAHRGPPGRRPPSGPERPGDHAVSKSCPDAHATSKHEQVACTTAYPRYLDAWSDCRKIGRGRPNGMNAVPWGRYQPAIRRWETITGRPAPYPTETGTKGQPRLSSAFSEWLMGLPAGFVTNLDLPYAAQHRVIGNGVVPQQADAALRQLVTLAAHQTVGALAPAAGARTQNHL
jgi:DNA (cytosine-5)-methyltransferase 1